MRVILVLIACVGLGGAVLGQSSRPTTGPSTRAATVAELIRQLSGDNWNARQAAQDKLVAMGEEAAEALRDLRTKTDDEELRTRAEAALKQIAQDDLTEPTRVTLQAKDRPADEVLGELCRQAGVKYNLDFQNDKARRVSVNFKDEPFWPCVREVCRQGAVAPLPGFPPLICFSTTDAGWAAAPAVCAQNILIVVVVAGRDRLVQVGTGQPELRGYFGFDVREDPKARLSVESIRLLEVTDNSGNSLLPPGKRSDNDYRFYPGPHADHWVNIRDLREGGDRIAVLKGTVDAVLYRYERWELRDPLGAKNDARRTSVGEYTIVAVEKLGQDEYQVKATSERPSQHDWPELEDRGGKSWDQYDFAHSNGPEGHRVTIKYHRPEGAGEPVRLVWHIGAKAMHVSVPFEFKNLPLP